MKTFKLTPPVREQDIQRLILDYLKAKKILAFRMNTGAASGIYKGKRWFMRFGSPGMADILAFLRTTPQGGLPLWIEVKREGGKLSPDQKAFQEMVQREGHYYLVAKTLDMVKTLIERGFGL